MNGFARGGCAERVVRRLRVRDATSAAIVLMIGGLTITGCGAGQSRSVSERPKSVLAPGSEICGTQLWKGAQTPQVRSFTSPGHYVVHHALIAGRVRPLVLQFTTSCHIGVQLAHFVNRHARIIGVAHSQDGGIAAVALVALHPGRVTLVAQLAGDRKIVVRVQVER
jgi:hypothetical protein